MNTPKICVTCGAAFTRSRSDSTVRCPDCRAGRTKDVAPCIVCQGAQFITSRKSDGTMVTDPCFRCNPR